MVVSIPVRVLGVLEPDLILMLYRDEYYVSIPVRVLGVLELGLLFSFKVNGDVSIPVRVLGVLEPFRLNLSGTFLGSFNPCKGFGGFGTIFQLCILQR